MHAWCFLCLLVPLAYGGILETLEIAGPGLEDPFASSMTDKPNLRISVRVQGTVAKPGDRIELHCEAAGSPPPVFTWSFNDRVIVGSQDNNLLEKLHNLGKQTIETAITVSKIVIPCAEYRHAGRYACVASNGYTTERSHATVKITQKTDPVCRSDNYPPQIIQHTESRFENSGNYAQLFCRAIGADQIIWYNADNEKLTDQSGYEILPNGDLLIKKADWNQLGVYTCVASNKYGEDRAETFFYPTEPEGEEIPFHPSEFEGQMDVDMQNAHPVITL